MNIIAKGINDLVPKLYQSILSCGSECSPRGMKTYEVIGASFEIENPRDRILFSKARKPNYPFMAAEFMWIAGHRNDVEMISFYNKQIAKFSDDGKIYNGAYGERLSNPVDQLDQIVKILAIDHDSRQAVATIFNSNDLIVKSKDIPCTVTLQFLIRGNALNLIVYMRSNDAWLGLPYDVFNFTCIQELVLARLRTSTLSLRNLEMGTYKHFVGSLHLYEQHWKQATEVISEYSSQYAIETEMPAMERDCLNLAQAKEETMRFLANEKQSIDHEVQIGGLLGFDNFWTIIILMLAYRTREDCLNDLNVLDPFAAYSSRQ